MLKVKLREAAKNCCCNVNNVPPYKESIPSRFWVASVIFQRASIFRYLNETKQNKKNWNEMLNISRSTWLTFTWFQTYVNTNWGRLLTKTIFLYSHIGLHCKEFLRKSFMHARVWDSFIHSFIWNEKKKKTFERDLHEFIWQKNDIWEGQMMCTERMWMCVK